MFEIHGANDTTTTLIAKKYTFAAALVMASELLDCWDDVHIRHFHEDNEVMLTVAKLSLRGLIL